MTDASTARPADASRRSLVRWIVLAVIGLIVLGTGGLFAYQALRPGEPPAQVATRYWQLLAQGKAEEALALTSAPSLPNGLLLTDAVYGAADRGISAVRASGFAPRGDTATGTVRYRLHGVPQSSTLELRRVDHGLLEPASWRITDATIATIRATIAGDGHARALSVDGRALPLPGGDGTIAIPALPGRYTLSLGSDTPLLDGTPQTIDVTGATGDSPAVTLRLAASAQLAAQAIAQAQSVVTGCFAQPDLAADCPLSQGIRNLFNLTAEETVSYHLDTAPTLAFDAAAMRVASTGDGVVTATPSDALWGTFQNHASFSLAFDVAIDGGGVVVTPDEEGVTLVQYVQ